MWDQDAGSAQRFKGLGIRPPLARIGWSLVVVIGLGSQPAFAMRSARESLASYLAQLKPFMPRADSGKYVVPTPSDQQTFAAVAAALQAGDPKKAEALLASQPNFEVIDFEDAASGRGYYLLAEIPPLTRGWGFYFFGRESDHDALVLEAPHPLADADSEVLAAEATSELGPAALLLAGAHRNAVASGESDVAHATSSIFESIHEVVMSSKRVAVQLHGFGTAGHEGFPDVVVSNGTMLPDPDQTELCSTLTAKSLTCALYSGGAYSDLGAEDNLQGMRIRRDFGAGHFVHVETADRVRADPALRAALVSALGKQWPSKDPGGCNCASSASNAAGLGWLVALGFVRSIRQFLVSRRRSV